MQKLGLSLLGFMSIMCALLVKTNKDKYMWLVSKAGFKNNSKIAISYYSILGISLIIGDFVDTPYVTYFILPLFVLFLSLLTILGLNLKKNNEAF